MYREYLYRYMDIKKCDVIKNSETCIHCGWELEFSHEKDKLNNIIIERVKCKGCGKVLIEKYFPVH